MRTPPRVPLSLSLAVALTLTLAPSGVLFAQVHQEWLARYDAAQHSDAASRMAYDGAGNIAVLGITEDSPGFGTLKTLKYDLQGTLLWDRSFGSSASWSIGGLVVDPFGNVVIFASPSTSNQVLIVKYDAAGNEVWVRTFDPGGCGGSSNAIATDSAGNVYVSGSFFDCQAPNSGTGILGTAKFSPSGDILWSADKRKRGEVAVAAGLAVDSQQNVLLAGYIQYGPSATRDVLALRYDSDGRERWARRVRNGEGVDIALAGTDTVVVGATSQVSGSETNFLVLAFATSNGRSMWNVTHDAGPRDDLQAIAVLGTEVYACGWSTDASGLNSDFITAKVSQAGVAWSRRFDRGDQDQCNDIALDAAGNAYATGVTNTPPTYLDFTTLKYDASGSLLWAEHYNGPDIPIPADGAIAVAVTSANEVIVTGSSTAVNQLSDIVTIKYAQP